MTAVVSRRRTTPVRLLPGRARSTRARTDAVTGWVMITPTVVLVGVFGLLPLVWSLVMSFQDNDLQTTPTWAGGSNYDRLVHDPVFWDALRHTVLYTVVFVPVTVIASLLVAGALNRKVRGITAYRLAVFIPVVTSTVATGVVFSWLLDPQFGLVNAVLTEIGLPRQGFFSSPGQALMSVVLMSVWGWVGFGTLIYLAALQGVPADVVEASWCDGATRRQSFWRVQVPLLRPVTGFLVVWLTINGLQLFDEVYVTTKGGPLHATTVLVYYLYQQAFSFFRAGYGAAIAMVLFVLIAAVTVVQLRLTRSADEETAR